ncbi:ATP-binding protein [Arthrobacter sp. H14]|uniref:ATP-binding protein n=1 Tax=Arthrobacter sp. H14 TaxID=1312959 RepID=UPI00047AB18E|nr:ATP-binding protein [Arthrobacter sp. H14]
MAENPFTPTFGVTPPLLVAREEELEVFVEGLEDGVGSPGRAMLITGTRGSGKTVLLNSIEDAARTRGWLIVSATTGVGVAEELATTRIAELLHKHDPGARAFSPTGGSAGAVGFTAGTQGAYENQVPLPTLNFRSGLERLADVADTRLGAGVLITLDEVHTSAIADLRQITQALQHSFREGRQVALVAAGLPSSVSDLLSDDVTSFLRRAERFTLGPIPAGAVRSALADPITLAGRSIAPIAPEALELAVEGTRGYPFLIQLVGHRSWRVQPKTPEITLEHARAGIDGAIRRAGRMIHEPALRDLSDVDRSFLAAMAIDEGPSQIADIAERMSVDLNYANQYRRRLLAAEMIVPAGRGRLSFTLPYLRDYLNDHAVTEALSGPEARP